MSKKARKQEKEGNEGSETGYGVTQRKPRKPHTQGKPRKIEERRKNRVSLKCKEFKQSQAVIKHRNR